MATLSCPSSFTRDWIEERHQGHIEQALSEALGRPMQVRLAPAAAAATAIAGPSTPATGGDTP